ncbi:MAG: hypothetical protein ACRD9R_20340, partial [Pyrinomonadaceae bacterium]
RWRERSDESPNGTSQKLRVWGGGSEKKASVIIHPEITSNPNAAPMATMRVSMIAIILTMRGRIMADELIAD